MARTLTSGQAAEVAKTVTKPGYLIEIGYSVPARYSTRATQQWRGVTWLAADVRLQGIAVDGRAQSGPITIQIGNADRAIATMIMVESAADKRIRVWSLYGDAAPADTDPIEIFNGFGDAGVMSGDGRYAAIRAYRSSGARRTMPRDRMTPENGFTNLTPAGTVIEWDGERFTLEAEDG